MENTWAYKVLYPDSIPKPIPTPTPTDEEKKILQNDKKKILCHLCLHYFTALLVNQ